MITPKPHINESERLKDLESYSVMDSLSEDDYDNLTAIAAEICGTPIALVSLVDDKRQWFKSHHGLAANETPKEVAFCAHAINEEDNFFIVPDARKDERFHDNPLVTENPFVIFYAGVPLVSDEGYPLGTLCVIDNKPKELSQSQRASLKALSNQVMNLLKLRKSNLSLEKALVDLEEKNKELDQFAMIAAHDINSPLTNISALVNFLIEDYGSQMDDAGRNMLALVDTSSKKLKSLVEGLLKYSRSDHLLKEQKTNIDLVSLVKDITVLFDFDTNIKLELKSSLKEISVNRTAIEQVLINLVTNAIKYNNNDQVEIEIGVLENKHNYEIYVQDNGWGIPADHIDKIFEIFEKAAVKDKFGKPGNGIGLATVKKIVEALGGSIIVESEHNNGSRFIFTIAKDL